MTLWRFATHKKVAFSFYLCDNTRVPPAGCPPQLVGGTFGYFTGKEQPQ